MLTILRMSLAFKQHRFNVDAMGSAPCIDVHTMIHRQAKTKWRFSTFSLFSLFFLSLFFLICFVFQVYGKVVLLNFLDTKVNPDCLLFSQRERERVAEVQS